MRGPLHRAVYDTACPVPSWWEASAPPFADPAPLEGEHTADVAIIGGGYAGLSAALRLAEHGIGAAVLEAGAIGWGSSGRNGGIVGLGGSKLSDDALARRFGAAEAGRALALQTEGLQRLRAFCMENGLADAVQGDGELILAHGPRSAAALRGMAPPPGGSVEPLPPSGLPDIARHGGMIQRPGFGIHPLRLVRALCTAAQAAGARVHPRSEVTVWERAGNGHRLITAGGALRAARVLLATNGFTPDSLHPGLGGRTVPVLSNIAVTRPLNGEERARHPWLGEHTAADTRNLLAYFRVLPQGRLLFGMRGDLRGAPAGEGRMRARIVARIAQALPGLAQAGITHFWRGPICATLSLRPSLGRLAQEPTVHHAFGWHGSGINMGSLAGRLIADVIAGAPDEAIPAPWRGLAPRVPLPGLRPLYVGAMLVAYALADRRG